MNERQLFESALEIADLQARQDFLDEACQGDAELRARVEALLTSHATAGSFLDIPAVDQLEPPTDQKSANTILSGQAGEHADERVPGEEQFRKYLQPATRPGWLGRLAHYEIEAILGQGAFGTVAKAFDEKLHRVVAIKLMSPELASTSPPRKRFLREARTAAAVTHENIVAIHAVEEEPIPYLVMEYVPGKTLQQWMDDRGPIEPHDILRIGQQVAAGLAAAHAVNLIHRDIKPSNILLTDGPQERAKISDFGLARAVDDAAMSSSGMIAGTPLYMAPEQARGEALDHRADLFSLGSVLYQMASGRPPFRAANTIAVLKRVCEDTPRALNDVIPGTPAWLETIIFRLLEKNRDDRYQSAQEVADLLTRCQRELEHTGQVTCVTKNAHAPDGISQATTAQTPLLSQAATPHSRREPARNRGVAYGVIMTLVAVVFVLGVAPRFARWFETPIPPLPPAPPQAQPTGLAFDGKDDRLEVNGLSWHYPQFTIEAFVTSAPNSDNGTIAYLGSGHGDDEEWMSLFDGGPAEAGKRISGAAAHGKAGYENAYGPFRGGERQHRALTCNGRHLDYFINGVWQGQRGVEPHEGGQWKMQELRIGCDGNGRKFFQGVIDQLRISRVARYSQNFELTAELNSDDQTLALYRFDEGHGELLKDHSGNGHDAKIVGARWVQPDSVPPPPPEPFSLQFDGDDDHVLCPDLPYPNQEPVQVDLSATPHEIPAGIEKQEFLLNWGMALNVMIIRGNRPHPILDVSFLSGQQFHQFALDDQLVVGQRFDLTIEHRDGHVQFVFNGQPVPPSAIRYRLLVDGKAVEGAQPVAFQPLGLTPDCFIGINTSQLPAGLDRAFSGTLHRLQLTKGDHQTVANFDFTHDSGNTLHDLSDNGNDGQIVGARWVAPGTPPPSSAGRPADAPQPAVAPFTADEARQYQEAWARYLQVPVEYTNSIGIRFRLIPPGEFTMGMTTEEAAALAADNPDARWKTLALSSAPQHKVRLSTPFYLADCEVTQEQYQQVLQSNPSAFSAGGTEQDKVATVETRRHPVENVSFADAAEFCIQLSRRDNLQPAYFRTNDAITQIAGNGYRLPTEAEWEFACRGGTTTPWNMGQQASDLQTGAWITPNAGGMTHSVGLLKPNAFGLYDMHGNVWEWCQDWHDAEAYTPRANGMTVDPHGPDSGSLRVMRGGSWNYFAPACHSATRRAAHTASRNLDLGFRLSMSVEGVKQVLAEGKPATPTQTTGWHGWPADAPPPAIPPFTADEAKAHQAAWAKYLDVPVEYENSIGMKFQLIPPGEFLMGSTRAEVDAVLQQIMNVAPNDPGLPEWVNSESPQHRVTLTQPIYVARHEVTQSEFELVLDRQPSRFSTNGEAKDRVANIDTRSFPVELVSWNDAAEFCVKLSQNEDLKPSYARFEDRTVLRQGNGYRLPTEAEWDYSSRAGTTGQYWIGDSDDLLSEVGWMIENSNQRPHPVGQLKPNAFGLFDTIGNVWEWTQDGWDSNAYEQLSGKVALDPMIPILTTYNRVIRGGCWANTPNYCRAAERHSFDAAQTHSHLGFRVVLSVDAVKAAGKKLSADRSTAKTGWHGWPADAPPPAIAPFNADEAKAHQAAWATYLKVPVEYTNSIGMRFRLIPPGEFLMGAPPAEIAAALQDIERFLDDDPHWRECGQSEMPQHQVILTQPFYMGVNEVLQSEFEQVLENNPSHFSASGPGTDAVAGVDTGRHPVEMVSWNDAADFCSRLSQLESLKPFYFRSGETITHLEGTGYRLPSEAEWEFACRAGTTTRFWTGDQEGDLRRAGWVGMNSGQRTHLAGELSANPLGLHDMHGNVWERVEDTWKPSYYSQFVNQPAINPRGPQSVDSQPIIKGGSWLNQTACCRSSTRYDKHPAGRDNLTGFRATLPMEAVRAAQIATGKSVSESRGKPRTMPALISSSPYSPKSDAADISPQR